MSAERTGLPGLVEQALSTESSCHGFELDTSGRVIVRDFHPQHPDEVSAYFNSSRGYSLRLMLRQLRSELHPRLSRDGAERVVCRPSSGPVHRLA